MSIKGRIDLGSKWAREQSARENMRELFGLRADQPQSDLDASILRNVELARGVADGSIPSQGSGEPSHQFKSMYTEDKSSGKKYKYIGRENDTFTEPPADQREISADKLLDGRLAKANPPKVYVKKGWIWERVDG